MKMFRKCKSMALMLLVAMQIFSVISSDVATVYAVEVTDNEES